MRCLERPDLYVLARFLDVLYENSQPMKKTNLQMRVGLNYPRFMEYFEWLISHGFLQKKRTELKCIRSLPRDWTRITVWWRG